MKKRILLGWFAALAVAIAATPALAQDEPAPAADEPAADGGTDDDMLDAIEASADEAPAPTGQAATTSDPTDAPTGDAVEEDPLAELDPDDKLYWATVRNIYTLQQRRFRKSGRFGVTLYGGLIPNNIFEQYVPIGLRLNYFILENIGIELAGSYNIKSRTGLENQIREENGVGAGQVLIGDTQVSHTNFGIVWSPFYGKAAFYNSGLLHFDLFLFAGAGMVVAETTPNFNADAEQEIKPEGALGAGLAFFMGDHFAGRIDFRQFVFQKVVGGVANPSEVSLGLSYFF
jgi:outer membrane beta-barrel protein